MTMTANTAWIAILTAPGLAIRETFEGLCDNGDKNSWTQARDFLVDEGLEESEHPFAEALSTLLCDADPEEAFHFEHSGITLTLTPVSETGGAPHQVERGMPETILTREDGTPVATFHVVDEWDEDEEEPIAIDEAEAHRLAPLPPVRALPHGQGSLRLPQRRLTCWTSCSPASA